MQTPASVAHQLIGQPCEGGIYAGLTIHRNEPFRLDEPRHLILLPGEFNGTWPDAVAWAKEQGGELPSRIDLLVLWQNVRDEFRRAWHWSSEQDAGDVEYAWIQDFDDGDQSYGHKGDDCRARAVRRVAIDQFVNSVISAAA